MGDRTTVELSILQQQQHQSHFEHFLFKNHCDADEQKRDDQLIIYTFHEVNYAKLSFEKELQTQLIPYDKFWFAGDEYDSSTEFHRVINGQSQLKEVKQGKEGMIYLSKVIDALEQNKISEFINKKQEEISLIPLEQQSSLLK